jgi:hypothetical protein
VEQPHGSASANKTSPRIIVTKAEAECFAAGLTQGS